MPDTPTLFVNRSMVRSAVSSRLSFSGALFSARSGTAPLPVRDTASSVGGPRPNAADAPPSMLVVYFAAYAPVHFKAYADTPGPSAPSGEAQVGRKGMSAPLEAADIPSRCGLVGSVLEGPTVVYQLSQHHRYSILALVLIRISCASRSAADRRACGTPKVRSSGLVSRRDPAVRCRRLRRRGRGRGRRSGRGSGAGRGLLPSRGRRSWASRRGPRRR